MILIILVLLFGALTIEGTFFAVPVVLALLIVMQIAYRSHWVMAAAFFAGIFLDSMLFRTIGLSSFFFLIILGLIALYERRFEVRSYPFLFSILLLGTCAYLVAFGSVSFLVQVVVSEVVGSIFFFFFVGVKSDHYELR